MIRVLRGFLAAILAGVVSPAALAAPLTSEQTRAIDDSVGEWLHRTGAPSVSIAVVAGGGVAYAKAYGDARLAPRLPATTDTRYAIDSVSKEFTAAAILLLQQQGRLRLDDPVSRFLPGLAHAGAGAVTIRQLLSHTGGLRDYWPQDYVPAEMTRPVTTRALIGEWATRPLDFRPGTDWQYSNTGYVVAGAVVEAVSGQTLPSFLQAQVFGPLGMRRVTEDDTAPLGPADAGATTRYGLGPPRPAAKEAAGWLFGASALAMTPGDLARWDISLIDRSLLQPASYEALTRSTVLAGGRDTRYGLGLEIEDKDGRREIGHDGAGSGFLAANAVWPAERVAVVALTNNDWASPSAVVDRVAFVVLPPSPAEARVRAVFEGFRHGTLDRGRFTANANTYLTPAVLADQAAGLAALGPMRRLKLVHEALRGGLRNRVWAITTANARVTAVERSLPDGRIEQFMIDDAD